MQDNNGTKLLIETIVREYVEGNPNEFLAFAEYAKGRKDQLDNDLADFKGSTFLRRALAEFPATLDILFHKKLPADDKEWFRSREGMTWFAQKFPVFATPERV